MAKRRGMVNVDLTPLVAVVAASVPHQADLARIIRGLGSAARTEWVRLAKTGLTSTQRDYENAIQEMDVEGNRVSISLVGSLPNMVEQGAEAFDLRETLLGPNSKRKPAASGGFYNTIPFRHGSAGSSGRNTGKPMPRAIHNVAKTLKATWSRPGGIQEHPGGHHVVYGERLHAGMPMGQAARKILTRKERPHHSTSIYTGMIREEKVYQKANQSKYFTFRRISTNVKTGWQHPGITGRKFAEGVHKYVSKVQQHVISKAMGSAQ